MKLKVRDSNFECLRIVAMLMILNLHSFVGSGRITVSDIDTFIIIDYLRESFSICAVNCFVLITGYFGLNWKRKSILNLIFQVYFYVIGLFLLLYCLGYADFSIGKILSRLNCLLVSYWFVSAYLVLYLLAPLLNNFIDNQDGKSLLKYIVVFYVVQTYFCLIGPKYFNDCLNFVGLYLCGRYLKNYPQAKILQLSKKSYLIYYVLFSILICLMSLIQKVITHDSEMSFTLLGGVYSNPLVILQSLSLFLFFSKLSVKSGFINWCGASALSIYLIDLSPDLKFYYIEFCKGLYDYDSFKHYLILLFFIPSVFVVCVLVDKIRIFIWNKLYTIMDKQLIKTDK